MTLPTRQKAVYEYILQYKKEHGYEPSAVAIANHFDLRSQSIVDALSALLKKGLIKPKKRELRGTYELCTPKTRRK